MIRILRDVGWTCDYNACEAKCCTDGIQLTLHDIENISKLGKSFDEFAVFDESTGTFRLKGKNGRCIFLSGYRCTIRESEPLVCRLLPFKVADVKYTDEPILTLAPVIECPGEGTGAKLDPEFRARIERDALLFLHEGQRLRKELREKGAKEVLQELKSRGKKTSGKRA
ncbi:MAG TPA: YkgJ family cysteine cluster protein [Candidatus Methanoperedenaceae archaeon]|nr:YkgJ family cysteine cluster protein [Candidatus Methanoperedenaceae archaeon]